ncbi:MAG: glycosyltransferase family 39 protein [Pseudomonadota bacterium]
MIASPAMFGRWFSLERVCQALTVLISVGFALAAFWELADTFGAGHFASSSAVCTGAENMWRWGVLGPVTHQLGRAPLPSDFYCHHPWGIFWVTAPFMKLFGHHAWACRLPAAIQSALTPPALYFAARALWGPVAGAVAAASFAALPIALSFSDFNSLEVPVIFGTVLAIWGYARFRRGYLRRFAALSLGGLTYAVCCDWAAVIFAAGMLGAVFASVFLLRRWTTPADRRHIATFWGLALALCGLAIATHLYVFSKLGQLNELFAQGNLRSTGSSVPLSLVLAARKFWIEVSFTGLAIGIGKVALPVLALRVLWRRTELEALPLAVFAMAAVQYVTFKQGADIHIFWPHYFALYFAFACAGLVHTALELSARVGGNFPGFSAERSAYAWGAFGLLVPLAILPDGLRALHYAHRSGGRFNENGHLIKPDKDKVAALEWLTARMARGSGVTLHPGMRQSLWVDWSLQRPVQTSPRLPTGPGTGAERYYVADQRFMTASEQDALASNFSVTVLGPYLALDRAAARGGFEAFAVRREEPSWWQAYWVSSSHALRRIVPDPYLGWEMRDRFGLSPNPAPSVPPAGFEQLRVAHNIAVADGDAAGAERWLTRLLRDTDRSHAQTFPDGNALLGARLERGTSLVFSVYFRAAGPDPDEPYLALHSSLDSQPGSSLVARDTAVAEVGMPFVIPASRWKAGYVYASETEVIRRIGSERWFAELRLSRRNLGDAPVKFEILHLE